MHFFVCFVSCLEPTESIKVILSYISQIKIHMAQPKWVREKNPSHLCTCVKRNATCVRMCGVFMCLSGEWPEKGGGSYMSPFVAGRIVGGGGVAHGLGIRLFTFRGDGGVGRIIAPLHNIHRWYTWRGLS